MINPTATATATATDQAEQDRATLDAVPIDDEIDADAEVRELEERLAAGDDAVTAEQLAEVRTAAAGRVRFARLRRLGADRKARRDADAAERAAATAADEHARQALAPYEPAKLVGLYDAAVSALAAYSDAVADRNTALIALGRLPRDERPRGLTVDLAHGPNTTRLVLDGHEHAVQVMHGHLRRVLAAAGVVVYRDRLTRVTGSVFEAGHDRSDPALIAEGRAQLAERKR